MITINGDVLGAIILLVAVISFTIGGALEYCQRGGTYDLRVALRNSYKESEHLREELYNAGVALGSANHPAQRALAVSVPERPHLSVVKSEPGA